MTGTREKIIEEKTRKAARRWFIQGPESHGKHFIFTLCEMGAFKGYKQKRDTIHPRF